MNEYNPESVDSRRLKKETPPNLRNLYILILILMMSLGLTSSAEAQTTRLTWAPPPGWENFPRYSLDEYTMDEILSKMREWHKDEKGDSYCTAFPVDMIIELPKDKPFVGNLVIEGGRNIVIIGGHVLVPWQGEDATPSARRGLKVQDCRDQDIRTVHIEGLEFGLEDISANCTSGTIEQTNFDKLCSDLSEGIQISAPRSIVRIQNVLINHIHARNQVIDNEEREPFDDQHPDLGQTSTFYILQVDHFTGTTDYQGFLIRMDHDDPPPVQADFKNVNIIGDPTAQTLFWTHPIDGAGPITLEEFYIQPYDKSFKASIFPTDNNEGEIDEPQIFAQILTDENGKQYAIWPKGRTPEIVGAVLEGPPPGGDFVKAEEVGLGYVSPGYQEP